MAVWGASVQAQTAVRKEPASEEALAHMAARGSALEVTLASSPPFLWTVVGCISDHTLADDYCLEGYDLMCRLVHRDNENDNLL